MASRTAAKYLEECGSFCPFCEADNVRRVASRVRHGRPGDAAPILTLPCYCARCGASWEEWYRLEGVSFDAAP